jgi:tetratricopeptide (TPR) repeat protein
MKEQSDNQEAGYSREAVLASCFVLLIAMFGVTAFVTRTYHKRIHTLADEWYANGEQALAADQADEAVTDFRNALVYSPNNSIFQFHLAQALIAARKWDDAEEYLQNLLSDTPGSGEINLALARIAAQKNALPDAMRYYHSAVFGSWQQDPIELRWNTRYELCKYLLAHNDGKDAEAEVIALADNTAPGDVERLDQAGNLLLQTQQWSRALMEFKQALARSRRDVDALAGAGTAAFQAGQFAEASAFFERLPKEEREKSGVVLMEEMSRQAEISDPFADGLSTQERVRRAAAALEAAEAIVGACSQSLGQPIAVTPATTDLQKLHAEVEGKKREWSETGLATHPDEIEAAMVEAFQLESASAQHCGEPKDVTDMALRLLARERNSTGQ